MTTKADAKHSVTVESRRLSIAASVTMALAPALLPAQESVDGLEEIVVTAQKRAERLQDVPIQVSVFSEQSIADSGIRATQDFVAYVPNMTFDRSDTYRNSFVVMRGLTQITNADSPVAVVVDGVPQNDQKQFSMRLFDIERIEVLKGPQGTLYGRNAIGGAVNIVTREPSEQLEGFAELSYGNGDQFQGVAGISGPLGDRVRFRISGDYLTDDGRMDNIFRGDEADYVDHDFNVRARLSFDASEKLSIDLRAQYGEFRGSSNQYSVVFSGDPNDFVDPRYNILPFAEGETEELTLKIDAAVGTATLTSITGYTHLTETNRADLDFRNPVESPGGFLGLGFQAGQGQDLDVDLLSQELRLVSSADQRLRWLVGLYYLQTDKSLRTRAFIDLTGETSQIDNPALVIVDTPEANDNQASAAFAQIDYDISDRLTLTTGVRYDRDEREQTNLATGVTRTDEFDQWQPKLTLSYKPGKDRTFYATVSTGFRSGGFNAPHVSIPEFAEETLVNYEIGFKSSWLNGRAQLNGAVFYEQVDDYQYFYVDAATASQIIANIDEVSVTGVELEGMVRLLNGWEAFAAFGYSDSEIEKLAESPEFVGNHTPRNTTWSAVAGVQYRAPFVNGLEWFGRVDVQHYGDKYWQVDNLDVQDPRTYLNLRLGLEGERWNAYVWGRNITDTKAYSDFYPREYSGLDVDIGYRVPRRAYGLQVRWTF